MSGKAAIVHHNYLRTWLIKFFCKLREVEDCKEIVTASDSCRYSARVRIRIYFGRIYFHIKKISS